MNELKPQNNNTLVNWDDAKALSEIRVLFAPKLTDSEFDFFIGIGKATGLNPFLRELWCIKYDSKMPAQIFIGRDGYRKSAQKHNDYDYHQVDSVYSNDLFKVKNGEVDHEYQLTDRGHLLGAYCLVKKHSSSRPVYTFVELKEYDTNKSNWAKMKATMIKKVAEAQALRSAFPSEFGGTYDAAEEYQDNQMKDITPKRQRAQDLLAKALPTYLNENQAKEIAVLFAEKQLPPERIQKALGQFNCEVVAKLSVEDADTLIGQLKLV